MWGVAPTQEQRVTEDSGRVNRGGCWARASATALRTEAGGGRGA